MDQQQPPEQEQDRAAIWSVPEKEKALYFGLFTLFNISGIVFVIAYEIFAEQNKSVGGIVHTLVMGIGIISVGSAGLSLTTMEVQKIIMVFARYVENKWVKPLERAREKIREEAREEGRQEGRQEVRQEVRQERDRAWRDWLERRDRARESGLPFDEPPPGTE